jgi:hypothetical protein
MGMVRQYYPAMDNEGVFGANIAYNHTQGIYITNKQIILLSLQQIYGKEVGGARSQPRGQPA